MKLFKSAGIFRVEVVCGASLERLDAMEEPPGYCVSQQDAENRAQVSPVIPLRIFPKIPRELVLPRVVLFLAFPRL